MTAFGYLARKNGLIDRASFLTQVSAARVSAVSDLIAEFTEIIGKIFFVKEIKTLKVQHRKARCIGNITRVVTREKLGKRKQLDVARRMSAALCFAGYATRDDGKGGKE